MLETKARRGDGECVRLDEEAGQHESCGTILPCDYQAQSVQREQQQMDNAVVTIDDDDVYYHIGERLKLEGTTAV